jgi:hypothetical protein
MLALYIRPEERRQKAYNNDNVQMRAEECCYAYRD